MASYRFLVQQLSGYFDGCEFLHVPRNDNEQADALARIGSTRQAIPAGVSLRRLLKLSVKPSPESDSIFVPAPPEAVSLEDTSSRHGEFDRRPGDCSSRTRPGDCSSRPGDFIDSASGSRLQPAASQPNRPRASCSPGSRRNNNTFMGAAHPQLSDEQRATD